MSKYNKFEDFMQSVINEADNKCQRQYNKSLSEAFDANHSIVRMIETIIGQGWTIFLAVVALLVLGPFGFGLALTAFVVTPIGIIVVGALTIFGGVSALRILYKNRILPIAIKETGAKYKSSFESNINCNHYIDNLIENASDDLLSKATVLLR